MGHGPLIDYIAAMGWLTLVVAYIWCTAYVCGWVAYKIGAWVQGKARRKTEREMGDA